HELRPRGGAEADWSLCKDNDRIADANLRRFRAAESRRSDVSEQNNLFVAEFIWNFREVRLCVWNQQIFSLRAVDGVAKSPSADRLNTFAVAALRPLRRQTSPALTARSDRADQNPVADLVSRQTVSEFFDHADRLMSDHQPRLNRVFAAKNVKISSADRG